MKKTFLLLCLPLLLAACKKNEPVEGTEATLPVVVDTGKSCIAEIGLYKD